jgi:hypothetical protein
VFEQPCQFGLKRLIITGGKVSALELFDRLNERFWNEASTVAAEISAGVRIASMWDCRAHD